MAHFDTPLAGHEGGEEGVITTEIFFWLLQGQTIPSLLWTCWGLLKHFSFRKCSLLSSYQAQVFVLKKAVAVCPCFLYFTVWKWRGHWRATCVHSNTIIYRLHFHRKPLVLSRTLAIKSSLCFLSGSSYHRALSKLRKHLMPYITFQMKIFFKLKN